MPTASTKPLDFWQDKSWHYKVHERLGETLYYFLVRARPIDMKRAHTEFKNMILARALGSVRVFPIFGYYDFLIRAWLHPSIKTDFRKWLDAALSKAAGNHDTLQFEVQNIDVRSIDSRTFDAALLENLTEQNIKDVQTEKDLPLLQRLMDGKLVITKKRTNNIRFFTSIYLDEENQHNISDVIKAVRKYLNDNPGIANVSIYRGWGFGSVLIKGEVENFFSIAPMPNHIGDLFKPIGAHTQTYLLHGSSHVAGDESIGNATFFALQGRNLAVQGIIPELYDSQSPNRPKAERFLIDEAQKFSLHDKDKQLLQDYFLGFLMEDPTAMATVLFAFFHKLEGYLRDGVREYIGRRGVGTFDSICDQANLSQHSRDLPSLRDLLHMFTTAIKQADPAEEYKKVAANWEEFGKLRNDVVHAKVDVLSNWNTLIIRLLPFLPKVRDVLKSVEVVNGKEYDGRY